MNVFVFKYVMAENMNILKRQALAKFTAVVGPSSSSTATTTLSPLPEAATKCNSAKGPDEQPRR